MRKFLLYLILLVTVTSCKVVKEVEVPVVNTKIEYRDKLIYDSIYCHDSVYTFIKGDTVIKYKEKINTRFINKTDTVLKTDTISVPITVTKIKEVNKLYWWQSSLMFTGLLTFITAILLLVFKLKKFI